MMDSFGLTGINGRKGRRVPAAVLALVLGACSAPQTVKPEAVTPEPVVAVERAFAADGYERGIKPSFTAYAAPDAIMFAPGPVNAHEFFAAQPDVPQAADGPHLVWWPTWAAISRSGDLGFDTGPYGIDDARRGYFFTVWQRQPDGSWKWLLDAGVDADPAGAPAADAPVTFLPVTDEGSASPDAAMAEVKAIEAAIAADPEAYAGYLADDARVHVAGLPPGTDAATRAAALAARPEGMVLSGGGGGSSAAGDMVWTWAQADWIAAGTAGRGFTVRGWQKRAEGWKIVFDELVPWTGPAPETEQAPEGE